MHFSRNGNARVRNSLDYRWLTYLSFIIVHPTCWLYFCNDSCSPLHNPSGVTSLDGWRHSDENINQQRTQRQQFERLPSFYLSLSLPLRGKRNSSMAHNRQCSKVNFEPLVCACSIAIAWFACTNMLELRSVACEEGRREGCEEGGAVQTQRLPINWPTKSRCAIIAVDAILSAGQSSGTARIATRHAWVTPDFPSNAGYQATGPELSRSDAMATGGGLSRDRVNVTMESVQYDCRSLCVDRRGPRSSDLLMPQAPADWD